MTAAVRDLHRCYPDQFQTDVRTLSPEIWENNPYITHLEESAKGVELIECSYPLIDRCNEEPYHCLHGFIDFLNARLGLSIKPTVFRGDIHISDLEKSWFSQVYEITKENIPFWLIVAGGKYDVTIKWWEPKRFQAVVDHFRGKIQFVQVGELGHHHPRLDSVIDLRGKTNLRELIRLVYHSQGVLCPVTALMHLAAAVPAKDELPANRPCVVVAGAREPAHWEAYPGHQYINTNGMVRCSGTGGCWRDRTIPLHDSDQRDSAGHLCVDLYQGLPRCMALITPKHVIERIEMHFEGGVLDYLNRKQGIAGRRGVRATLGNSYDEQPLNLHNARAACEQAIQDIPPYPRRFSSRGIVICGGGLRYFPSAWVCIRMLRHVGCALPIELWYLGSGEMDLEMCNLVKDLDVTCIDALQIRKRFPVRRLGGWELKPYAILQSRFQEILLLDADNMPVINPEHLFDSKEYRLTGAVFWPDYGQLKQTQVIWNNCGLPRPLGPELESGQILVNKRKCWRALCLALWFNEHSDFYYQYLYGDKETFHLAFAKLDKAFSIPSKPIHSLDGVMCQHDFSGKRIFQHRNQDKWNLFLTNKHVSGFWHESKCREFIRDLQVRWDGRSSRYFAPRHPLNPRAKVAAGSPEIMGCMISCRERDSIRKKTLKSLALSDWPEYQMHIELDETDLADPRQRQTRTTFLALSYVLESTTADYILFLEDDISVNRFIHSNLLAWPPLRERRITLAGLYDPNLKVIACNVQAQAAVVDPDSIFGSQAFLFSRRTAKYFIRHWNEIEGRQDIKMSRLAVRLGSPIFYHFPSLVQHVGVKSTWGGTFHRAVNYDPTWRHSRPEPVAVARRSIPKAEISG